MDFPELTEVEGKLANRRKALADIFAEAGPTIDMAKIKSLDGDSAAKVEAIRGINEEIDTLAKQAEPLRMLKDTAERIASGAGTEPGSEPGAEPESGPGRTKSIGDLFAEVLPKIGKKGSAEVDVDVKTTFLSTTGFAPQAVRTGQIVEFATRPIALLDRIPSTTTQQNAIVYMEETTFTNAAVEIAEGAAKPEAALAFTERTSSVRKIAVFLPVSDESLEDVPRIKDYLDNRLGFMVRQRLASQILVGNGTAPNLRGILNVVGIQTQAKGADPTPDSIYKAMVLIMTTGQAQPDTVVFNPLDWQDVRLLRTSDGIYIWGSPADAGPERIWGLPVILEQGLTQNTAIVGAFNPFSELAVKKGLTVETGYNGSDWTNNLQTIRAELRAAFIVYRPTAFCSVTGV